MMTDDEMRVAIAQKCGWKAEANLGSVGGYVAIDPHGSGFDCCLGATKRDAIEANCPDYLTDLNACASLSALVPKEKREAYAIELLAEVGTTIKREAPDWYETLIAVSSATARQRCEAFARVCWPERWAK